MRAEVLLNLASVSIFQTRSCLVSLSKFPGLVSSPIVSVFLLCTFFVPLPPLDLCPSPWLVVKLSVGEAGCSSPHPLGLSPALLLAVKLSVWRMEVILPYSLITK